MSVFPMIVTEARISGAKFLGSAGRGDVFEKLCIRFPRGLHRGRSIQQNLNGVGLTGSAYPVKCVKFGRLSYRYSGMARPFVTKFGVCLEAEQQCIIHGQRAHVARAQTQMCTLLRISGIAGWMVPTEIWSEFGVPTEIGGDSLDRRFIEVKGGIYIHVRIKVVQFCMFCLQCRRGVA